MIAFDLVARTAEEFARVVRALGAHRYIAGRMHMVHAFTYASVPAADDEEDPLADARAWAHRALSGPLDIASRDERLWRRSTEAEALAALDAFWTPGPRAEAARSALRGWLEKAELPVPETAPFDEAEEEDIHPLLLDLGWELLPLCELHPERHRGAVQAFGDALYFEAAKFEEETSIPPPTYLQELPGIGPAELLNGVDGDGALAEPLVLWTEGSETYHDYIVRGVLRAAKLSAATGA